MEKYRVLSEEQVQSFLNNGYLVVRDCVDVDVANRWIGEAYGRLGYDRNNPDTWDKICFRRKYKTKYFCASGERIFGRVHLKTQTKKACVTQILN